MSTRFLANKGELQVEKINRWLTIAASKVQALRKALPTAYHFKLNSRYAAILVGIMAAGPYSFAATYYINPERGDDRSTGNQPAASAGSAADGPWQTLGRLATAPLRPGDTVYLACGSVWNETLRIPSSGTRSAPIVISAGPDSCDSRPAIDGAMPVPSHMWTQHAGRIYRTRLPIEHISNSALSENLNGWHVWSPRNDASISLDTSCAGSPLPCMSLLSGAAGGIAISNGFSLAAGINYSARMLIRAPAGTRLQLAIRRGGPSYESLVADQYVTTSGSWQAIDFTFRASRSAPNARFDIQAISENVRINVREVHVQRILASGDVNEVFVDGSAVRRAHHPNFGRNGADPDSSYATVETAGGTTTLDIEGLSLPGNASLIPGLGASIRTETWSVEERRVASVSGTRLTLDKPTTYPIKPGYGYFLTGALWMVDSPGEWYFDSSTGDLYIWMPDDAVPGNRVSINSLSVGADLSNRAHVDLSGLAIRRVTKGVSLSRANTVRLRNMALSELGDQGIEADYSHLCAIESSSITNTGLEAVRALGGANGFSISDSSITNAGGDARNDGWRRSTRGPVKGALNVSDNATILRNKVRNSAHNGIFVGINSVVQDNYFSHACLRYTDCGGIYTGYYGSNSSIIGNLVDTVVGDVSGLPTGWRNHTVGIYLDDLGTGFDIRRNTVTNADYGIQIHNSSQSTIAQNLLFGNRRYQIWMQEQTARVRLDGDIFENRIESNTLVPTEGGPSILMESEIGDTSDFAVFLNNHYSGLISPRAISEGWPGGSASYHISEWLAKGQESGAFVTQPSGYASFLSDGSNIVPNGDLTNGSKGWTWWTLVGSRPQAAILSCSFGTCLQLTANSDPASLSSPNFSVAAERWYRVSFDAATSQGDQPVNVVVRRGGGGSADYQLLMPGRESFLIGTDWRRYSFLFRATQSIIANDPATGELGARVDFEGVKPGTSMTVGRVEVVPLKRSEAALQLRLRLNRALQSESVPCAQDDEIAGLCDKFVHLSAGDTVDWSSTVDPLSGQVVYTRDTSLLDEDGDGVADAQDICPNTAPAAAVNGKGCGFSQ